MKNKKIKRIILVAGITLSMSIFAGCGADESASADQNVSVTENSATTDAVDTVAQSGDSDSDWQAKYEELQIKYDELEDYSIYLEQQIAVMQAEYAQIKGQIDMFTQDGDGSKVFLVDSYSASEDTEEATDSE